MSSKRIAISFLLLAMFAVPSLPSFVHQANGVSSSPISFTFAAGGDFGNLTQGSPAVSLSYLAATNPDFFLALGDLSYDNSTTGRTWCNEFKAKYSNVEVISGAHDTGEFPPNGNQTRSTTRSYEKFVEYCPFALSQYSISSPVCGNVTGQCYGGYGREYYFDYPRTNPMARFILISPGIFNITGGCSDENSPPCIVPQPGLSCNTLSAYYQTLYNCWPYARYDSHYNWTSTAISNARRAGEWVIVGMHKPCISAGKENCDIGPDIFNLLLGNGSPSLGVDLILEGNDHAYERSKQFTLQGTCNKVPYNTTTSFVDYNQDCTLGGDGSDGFYLPHAGAVLVVQGTMGGGWDGIDGYSKNQENAQEAPYFAKLMGNDTVYADGVLSHGPWAGAGHGFVKYTVSSAGIDVETVFTGTFQDKFRITRPPVPSFSWTPRNLSIGGSVTFNSSVSGGTGPFSYSWDFGDGALGEGPVVTHAFSQSQLYTVTLTVSDTSGSVGTDYERVAIGSWNPVVQCSPVQTTIEEIIGPQGIQRDPDPNSRGADYYGGGFQLVPNLTYGSNTTTWPFYKRAVNLPPNCSYGGTPAFVELHNVGVRTVSVGPSSCGRYFDVSNGGGLYPNGMQSCVTGFNLENWNYTSCPGCYLHRVYAYIDRDWNASGVAPYPAPVKGERIDVQGFIYWEYSSVTADWHSFSGWELLVTGWKASQQNQTQPPPTSPTPKQSSRIPMFAVYVVLGALFVGVFALGIFYERRRARSRNQRGEYVLVPNLLTPETSCPTPPECILGKSTLR